MQTQATCLLKLFLKSVYFFTTVLGVGKKGEGPKGVPSSWQFLLPEIPQFFLIISAGWREERGGSEGSAQQLAVARQP